MGRRLTFLERIWSNFFVICTKHENIDRTYHSKKRHKMLIMWCRH